MASSDNIFNVVLIAIVGYAAYVFIQMKDKVPTGTTGSFWSFLSSPGITPGEQSLPSTPTSQNIDPCLINPLQPNCIAAGLINFFGLAPNVQPIPLPDVVTAHPSQTWNNPDVASTAMQRCKDLGGIRLRADGTCQFTEDSTTPPPANPNTSDPCEGVPDGDYTFGMCSGGRSVTAGSAGSW